MHSLFLGQCDDQAQRHSAKSAWGTSFNLFFSCQIPKFCQPFPLYNLAAVNQAVGRSYFRERCKLCQRHLVGQMRCICVTIRLPGVVVCGTAAVWSVKCLSTRICQISALYRIDLTQRAYSLKWRDPRIQRRRPPNKCKKKLVEQFAAKYGCGEKICAGVSPRIPPGLPRSGGV